MSLSEWITFLVLISITSCYLIRRPTHKTAGIVMLQEIVGIQPHLLKITFKML